MTGDEAEVHRVVAGLQSGPPDARAEAAEVVSDVVGSLANRHLAELVLQALVAQGALETDLNVREAILHALVELCCRFEFEVDHFVPIIEIDVLDEHSVGYVLYALASTHDPSVRPILERFLGHESGVVRKGVADALGELNVKPA